MSLPLLLDMTFNLVNPNLSQGADGAIVTNSDTTVASNIPCYGYSESVDIVDDDGIAGEVINWDIVTQYDVTLLSKNYVIVITDDTGSHRLKILTYNGISAKGNIPGFTEITAQEFVEYDG